MVSGQGVIVVRVLGVERLYLEGLRSHGERVVEVTCAMVVGRFRQVFCEATALLGTLQTFLPLIAFRTSSSVVAAWGFSFFRITRWW